jgi:hypothetical protein
MSEVSETNLAMHGESATDKKIARGIAAAQAVFDDAGVTAWEAATARFRRDNNINYLDENGAIRKDWTTEAESRISQLWDDAVGAAAQAFRAGGAKGRRIDLELVQ